MTQRGFTLIELSIVLMVIGLIVGGVLVGRDLIHAAEIRKTISQYEQFNTAVNAFRGKYNCLPGDCVNADQFGMGDACLTLGFADGTCTNGNGDGMIGSCNYDVACSASVSLREYTNFWHHLSVAGFIPHPIRIYDSWPLGDAAVAGIATPPAVLKAIKTTVVGGRTFISGWAVKADSRYSQNALSWVPDGDTLPAHILIMGANGTPDAINGNAGNYAIQDIYAIDQKTDDGLPASGKARGWNGNTQIGGISTFVLSPGNGSGYCGTTDNPPLYNASYPDTTCGLSLKAAF